MERLSRKKRRYVIMGDMNIDLMRMRTSDNYFQSLVSNGTRNMVSFPTRVTNETETIIDHILTNITEFDCKPTAGTVMNDISDHFTTFAIFPTQKTMPQDKPSIPIQVLSFKKYNPEEAKAYLQNEDWTDVFSQVEVDNAFSVFASKLTESQSRVIQRVDLKVQTKFQQPWMTSEIRKAQKERYRLYKKSKARPNNQELSDRYKRYRNNLCRIMRGAEKEY